MGDCGLFCRKFYFLVISIVVPGVVLALLIALLVLGISRQLFKADSNLIAYFIAATVVIVLLFLFSLWVSCHHSTRARIVLAVFFLIYSLGLIVLAIFAFLNKNTIVDDIAKLWDWTSKSKSKETAVNALEKAFKCCGWNTTRENCSSHAEKSCQGPITDDIKKYWQIGAGCLLGFGILLVIAVVFAFRLACTEQEDHLELKSQGSTSRFTDPLDAGGATTDSKGPYKYTW
jgi:hypothetical protein